MLTAIKNLTENSMKMNIMIQYSMGLEHSPGCKMLVASLRALSGERAVNAFLLACRSVDYFGIKPVVKK